MLSPNIHTKGRVSVVLVSGHTGSSLGLVKLVRGPVTNVQFLHAYSMSIVIFLAAMSSSSSDNVTQSVRSFVRPFVRPSVCPSVRPSVHVLFWYVF